MITPRLSKIILGFGVSLFLLFSLEVTFRVFFRVFMGPVEYHPGADHHDADPWMHSKRKLSMRQKRM